MDLQRDGGEADNRRELQSFQHFDQNKLENFRISIAALSRQGSRQGNLMQRADE